MPTASACEPSMVEVTLPPLSHTASVMSCGSLNRSKATSGEFLNVFATCCQNVTAAESGMLCWPTVPHLLVVFVCRSRSATMPSALIQLTTCFTRAAYWELYWHFVDSQYCS